MRHAQSLANVEGIIVSKPENGIPAYGLSERGKQQVADNAALFAKQSNSPLGSTVCIYSSDFKRAHETAAIMHGLLNCSFNMELTPSLRERDFGDFELQADSNYQTPWGQDAFDSSHTLNNVESADSVMARATLLVDSLEKKSNNETYLLVAHGDTLQILQTAFLKLPASKQRDMPHLENAEIRELVLA